MRWWGHIFSLVGIDPKSWNTFRAVKLLTLELEDHKLYSSPTKMMCQKRELRRTPQLLKNMRVLPAKTTAADGMAWVSYNIGDFGVKTTFGSGHIIVSYVWSLFSPPKYGLKTWSAAPSLVLSTYASTLSKVV